MYIMAKRKKASKSSLLTDKLESLYKEILVD